MPSKNRNHCSRGFKRSQVVQLTITSYPFNRAYCLKTINWVGDVECSSHIETREAQVVSPQLPQQKAKILHVENFPQVHQVVKNLISLLDLLEFCAAGRLQFFLQNWEKLASNSFILNTVQGFQIPFLSEPSQGVSPHAIPMDSEQTILVDQEIQVILKKGTIKPAHSFQKQFLSPIFLFPKKDSGQKPILNMKKLNQRIRYAHFKKEGLFLLKESLQENDCICKIDLRDAYFLVPLSSESQKFIRFKWKGQKYQFICLCFGLAPAPGVFTKLLKIPISVLRKLNVRLMIIFLDDILIMASSIED